MKIHKKYKKIKDKLLEIYNNQPSLPDFRKPIFETGE